VYQSCACACACAIRRCLLRAARVSSRCDDHISKRAAPAGGRPHRRTGRLLAAGATAAGLVTGGTEGQVGGGDPVHAAVAVKVHDDVSPVFEVTFMSRSRLARCHPVGHSCHTALVFAHHPSITSPTRLAVLFALGSILASPPSLAQSSASSPLQSASPEDRALEYVLFAAQGSLTSFRIVAAPDFRLVSRAQHRVHRFDPRRVTEATWRQWIVPLLAHRPPFENGEALGCSAARHRCEFYDAAGTVTLYRFSGTTQTRLLEVSIATESGE
jgi:hypothetical protein